jgi:hypothetical protein
MNRDAMWVDVHADVRRAVNYKPSPVPYLFKYPIQKVIIYTHIQEERYRVYHR